MREADVFSLVADVGGTNTRVALARGDAIDTGTVRRFSNAEHAGLASVIEDFIAEMGGVDCNAAAVAVAGPVRDEVGTLTNLDWRIDKPTLARATKAERVSIMNDLQAQGQALGHLPPENVVTVLDGPDPGPHAAKLVIGVGTGFNAAPVWEAEQGRLVPPSECGHANLPIRTEADLRLAHFVESAHGFPGVEDVLSGRGLERIYRWLGQEAGEPSELSAARIVAAAADGSDSKAVEAARTFVRILGTVCGNLSLIHLPFGGVYLIGGVARAFKPWLDGAGFADAFRDKGRFAGFMRNFAVHLIEDDYAALTGMASFLAADVAKTDPRD